MDEQQSQTENLYKRSQWVSLGKMSKASKLTSLLVTTALILLTAGCRHDLPEIKEASIINYAEPDHPLPIGRMLDQNELANLPKWFDAHPKGWRRSFICYAPEYCVYIDHRDGTQTLITIWYRTGPVKITVAGSQHYYEKKLTNDEAADLLHLLGETKLNEPVWQRD